MNDRKRVIFNYCLIIMVFGAWLWMFIAGIGELASTGFRSLKYFTVLSNLLVAITAIVWLAVRGRSDETRRTAETLKFVAANAVALTFTTVMVFLGPIYGYPFMFQGANLFFHGIVPVAAVCEIIFMSDTRFDRRDNLLALIPTLIYGTFYAINIIVNGRGEPPNMNDFYMFFAWGYDVGAVVYVIMTAVTYLLGLLMRRAQRAVIKVKEKGENA